MQRQVIGRWRLQKEEGLWDGKMPFAGQEEKVVWGWSVEVREGENSRHLDSAESGD